MFQVMTIAESRIFRKRTGLIGPSFVCSKFVCLTSCRAGNVVPASVIQRLASGERRGMLYPMRKGQMFAVLIGFGVLAAALAVCLRSPEPEYGGRRLSQWVEGYNWSSDVARYTTKERQEAMRQMGTNAIPYLLKWIRYETPHWKIKWYEIVNPALAKVRPSWQLSDEKEQLRANGTVLAFIALGAQSERAVGELSRLTNDPKASRYARLRAGNVLSCVQGWRDFPQDATSR